MGYSDLDQLAINTIRVLAVCAPHGSAIADCPPQPLQIGCRTVISKFLELH